MPTFAGRCYCGAVTLTLLSTPPQRCYCHCRSCQRASGAPVVAWGTLAIDQLQIVGAAPAQIARGPVTRTFCAQCSSPLTYAHAARTGEVDVCLSLFDDGTALAPSRHIWVAHKAPWLVIGDELPQFAGWAD